MVAKTLEVQATAGQTGLTVSAYPIGTDSVAAQVSAAAATEATNRIGWYTCTADDLAAGDYQVKVLTSGGALAASWLLRMEAGAATYQAQESLPIEATDVWAAGTRALTTASNITSDGSAITMSSSGVVGTVNLANTATTVTNEVSADVTKINNNATAAVNLDYQYDGSTGLSGDLYPSTQAQVGGIGASSGGALNYEVGTDNTGVAIKSVTFVGSQTNTYSATEAEDSTYHQIDHTGNAIDIVYQIDIGGNRTAAEAVFKGYLDGSNDALNIQAYDFIGADWETRAVLSGQAGSSNIVQTVPLLSKHTGLSGADIGLVLIRFQGAAQTSPVLYVDELLVAGVSLSQTVGYSAGEIWVDTINGTAGSESFVNGVADNPVSTWADALTLSTNLGIQRFRLVGASTITLTANSDSYTIVGDGTATLTLAGQSVSGAVISGCILAGNDDGSNTVATIYRDCTVGTQSFGLHRMENCGLSGTLTLAEAGTFDWINCHSRVAGTGTPAVNVGTAVANTNLNMRNYSGGIEVQEFGDTGTDTMSLEGQGQLVINANCSGGTIAIRGAFTVTDNASGAVTLSDEARLDMPQINAEVDTGISDAALATAAALSTAQTDLDTITGSDGVTLATTQGNYAPSTTAEMAAAKENIDWALTVLVGALSNAGTAAETYTFTVDGTAYTVTFAGLDALGNRGTTVLSKV